MLVLSQTETDGDYYTDTAVALEQIYESGVPTRVYRCTEASGYWKMFLEHWNHGDILVNIGRDIVPSLRHIDSLADCPADSCTFPYMLRDDRYSLFRDTKGDPKTSYYTIPFPQYAEGSGLGCVKIGLNLQYQIDAGSYPVATLGWPAIEMWLADRMRESGLRWHVHNGRVRQDFGSLARTLA